MSWIFLDWIAGALHYALSRRTHSWDYKNIYMNDSYDGYQKEADS